MSKQLNSYQLTDDRKITVEDVVNIARAKEILAPNDKVKENVRANWDTIGDMLERGDVMYGLNTGIGGFGNVRISKDKAGELSTRMLMAHSSGWGEFVEEEIARATSGDLAPLSQMGLVLIGQGNAYYQGKLMSGRAAMKKADIPTLKLAYREGLALMNGTQYMSAVAAFNVYDVERLIRQFEIIGSMNIEVLNCVSSAYSKEYNAAKLYPGQSDSANNLRLLMKGSEIMAQPKLNVQNAYALRSVPQVMGAVRESLKYVRQGYSQDLLKILVTDMGNLMERQTNNLMDPACSKDLPAFLVKSAGLDSGLMISQYTQAALVAENKVLAGSCSVDSIPVSANQEDHVSFGTISARQAREIIKNTEAILAIQLLAVCQAYEFRRPLKPSSTFQAVYDLVRSVSPAITKDRIFYLDIDKVLPLVKDYRILEVVENIVGKLK
ncbi:MAG: histidine ammonia-lyase [Microgenomates group bacterium GW2011_GWA2_46_16]|nr:MAG: histidine ammonia-lyase [Microgenomates group bacterium GW2011_GWA2_46_16]